MQYIDRDHSLLQNTEGLSDAITEILPSENTERWLSLPPRRDPLLEMQRDDYLFHHAGIIPSECRDMTISLIMHRSFPQSAEI